MGGIAGRFALLVIVAGTLPSPGVCAEGNGPDRLPCRAESPAACPDAGGEPPSEAESEAPAAPPGVAPENPPPAAGQRTRVPGDITLPDELQASEAPFELPPVVSGTPAAEASIRVERFAFAGNRVVSSEELSAVAASYVGRDLTASDLETLRQSLTRYYVDRGFIASGATLPEGFYRDGVVSFRIVEGTVSELRFQGLGGLRESYVRGRLVSEGDVFNANLLQERFQLMLNDPLFRKVNARLEPGRAPGEAILNVDVTRARPWEFSLYTNNYRSPSTGSQALGASLGLRNLTGFGDALDLRAQGRSNDNALYGAGWAIPLVSHRTMLNVRFDRGRSNVLEEPLDSLDVKSLLDSREIGLTRLLSESIAREVTAGVAFAVRKNRTFLLGEPFSFVAGEDTGESKVYDWRFDQGFVQRWASSALALRSSLTTGRTNTRDSDTDPRVIPADHYVYWIGQLQYSKQVKERVASFQFRMSLQWSRDRLVPLSRFAAGGINTVRGYRENQLVRDQGLAASLEFQYTLFDDPQNRHRITLVPFVDYGTAFNKSEVREELAAVGLGLRWTYSRLFAELYYGERLIEPEFRSKGDLQDRGVHFQVRWTY